MIAGVRSRRGRAFELLSLVGTGRFTIRVSVPLILEYEAVLRQQMTVSSPVIEAILDYHCVVGEQHRIFFLWRPYLADPKDDMILEVAVTGHCEYIVT
jgi:predicted nucleic acid-binding protein